MTTTRIDLIRHGEPEGGNVFRGRIDPALTATGEWQFRQRLTRFSAPWQRIISSPLQRCAGSAAWLAAQRGIPLQLDEQWIEIDYGEWENRPVSEVLAEDSETARRLWADPLNFCAPGGESVPQLVSRVAAAWESLLQQYAGEHILLVSHGGVLRILAQQLLCLAPQAMNRLALPYAGFMRFRADLSDDDGSPRHWITLEAMEGSELIPQDREEER